MGKSLYWMHGAGCGGDTWSLMNADAPDPMQLFSFLNLELLWHPTLSTIDHRQRDRVHEHILSGQMPLDIFVLEGSVLLGPNGTGQFDRYGKQPKFELIHQLASKAKHVLAIGTCASFGGIGGGSEIQAVGLQFTRWEPGGLLGADFTATAGQPVINLPGCPCHCDVISGALTAIAGDTVMALDEYQCPQDWYGVMVHQGCTRNEYHEYRVEEKRFGEKGCLFFYMGCHGPLVKGPCNKALWHRRSSKTRVGVPCFGCTRPDFPQQYPFFETRNIEGIPIELPHGVSRAHYMAYKGMAAAAAPKRLLKRKTGI